MDHLIRPFMAVFAFWWVLLFFWFGEISDFPSVLGYLMGGAAAFLIGGGLGALFSYLARTRVVYTDLVRRLAKKDAAPLGASPTAGAFVTIGALPGFGKLPPMATVPPDASWVPPDLLRWWRWYEDRHPGYARSLTQAWAIMQAADLPAAAIPGGHGQATLVEHSWNVLRTLLRLKELPPYRGMTNKEGKITFPLLDATKTEFRFDREDPLPMLCAFAHDIGKVTCFVKGKDGRITVVKDDHDTEGQRLVRRLSAWRMLDFAEYQRALICLGYYHKPSEVPRANWIDDRARALLMLIHQVDEWTSELEGRGFYDKYIRHPLPRDAAAVTETVTTATEHAAEYGALGAPSEQAIEAAPEALPAPYLPAQDEPEWHHPPSGPDPIDASATLDPDRFEQATGEETEPEPTPSTEGRYPAQVSTGPLGHISDAKIIAETAGVLLKSGALMGVIAVNGVGFKYGSWVYLHVPRLNSAMKRELEESSDPLFEPSHCVQHTPGQPTEFTKRLMLALANQGALKQEHEGKYYGPATAFFFLKKLGKNGEVIEEQGARPYFIIARAFAFGRSVFGLPDVRREPVIDRPVRENAPLTDDKSIERVRALMQSWTEPKSDVARKEEVKQTITKNTMEELAANGVGLMPFDLGALSFMDPADIQRACVKSPDGETVYRVSVLGARFAPPQVPHDIVDVDGEPCWRLLRRDKGARKK
jgi:hypothetical protein